MGESRIWPSPGMKEYPFWKEGMSVEEFEKEREYYQKNFDKVLDGTYQPLWKKAI